MRLLPLFILFCLLTHHAFSQNDASCNCTITRVIDLDHNGDPNIKKIYDCWSGYLASKPDSLYNNPYWNDVDKNRYVSYDLLKSEASLSPGLYAFGLKNQVLSITNMGDH